ncbi:MAG TPA: cbb3-type cytochrome c oxidase subunit I [Longimicrobiales bacterium]
METGAAPRTETHRYFEVDDARSRAFEQVWSAAPPPFSYLKEINNIPIAKRYIFASFAFFFIAGAFALLMRTQLAVPENDFLDPQTYNQFFTMHGTTMMFLFVIPFIEAVANYFLPLQLGARDLPFPRMTTLALWTYIWGGLFIFVSFLFGVAPEGGWFAYVPLSNREFLPGLGMDFWDIGLSVAEIAAMGAGAELIIAVLRMRAPGQALHRMPIFAWAMLVFAFMIIFAFTPLIVATLMLELDRKALTSFFVPAAGGDPLLWQHLFWFFGHPEVYIMFIPAIGMVSQILPAFTRRPLVGYTLIVMALIAIGFVSFGLWVHHMFATGLSPTALGFFAATSLLIAIPSGVQIFAWIATIWTGRPVWRTPLLFIAGFMVIFVMGGVTGTMVGAVPFDLQVHDSFFVVAHFHYVLIGGVVFPFYAMLYYWMPKVTGRLLSERLGKWQFWLMFIFFNLTFFPMHELGLLGMPRRIYTYEAGLGWETHNLVATVGAWGFGLSAALIVVNLLWSLKWGEPAGANPWNAGTLEWWEPSPPPNAQFKFIPFVRSREPLWDQESVAPRPEEERDERLMEPLRSGPTRWRGALIVSVLDARPLAITQMPSSTLWPFIMSVGFVVTFAGLLVENLWILGPGLAVIGVSVIGWFWPDKHQAAALAEIDTEPGGDRLPLAIAGPISNGWWAMLIFLLVMATALATFIGSYFYLGDGPTWPPAAPEAGHATLATLAALAVAGATYAFAHGVRRRRLTTRRLGLVATAVLAVVFLVLSFGSWTALGIRPRESAYGSAVVTILGFEWLMALMLLVLVAGSLIWAYAKPADPRGHGLALIGELQGYFLAGSWVAVYIVLYLLPRLW